MTIDDARHALMISFAFPPTGGPGVQRSAKFAKFLPQFHWNPIVWCGGPVDTLPRDDTLSDDLPDRVIVHRHPHSHGSPTPPKPNARWRGRFERLCRRMWRGDPAVRHPDEFMLGPGRSGRVLFRTTSSQPALNPAGRTGAT